MLDNGTRASVGYMCALDPIPLPIGSHTQNGKGEQ